MENIMIKETHSSFFDKLIGFIQYHLASLRNYYPCKLVGEKQTKEKCNTVILYRMLGKRDVHEILIQDLLATPELVAKFHPTEAVKLGSIAMGDLLLKEGTDMRKEVFDEIREKMLSVRG